MLRSVCSKIFILFLMYLSIPVYYTFINKQAIVSSSFLRTLKTLHLPSSNVILFFNIFHLKSKKVSLIISLHSIIFYIFPTTFPHTFFSIVSLQRLKFIYFFVSCIVLLEKNCFLSFLLNSFVPFLIIFKSDKCNKIVFIFIYIFFL